MDEKIDSVDLKLLRMLSRDAWTSLKEMGREVGLSTSGVKRRIDRLRKIGVIQSNSIVVDPRKCGLGTLAFVVVEIDSKSMRDLVRALERKREITEIYKVAGGDHLMLKIRSRGIDELNEFIEKNLTSQDTVKNVNTLICLESYKEVPFVP